MLLIRFFLENVIMRIAIIGYSGSGKSTLRRFLGEKYVIPMLHFDTVQFAKLESKSG